MSEVISINMLSMRERRKAHVVDNSKIQAVAKRGLQNLLTALAEWSNKEGIHVSSVRLERKLIRTS